MAQEKVFSIKIDGLEQSIKSAETLYDALMKLQGAVEGKASATTKLTQEEKAANKVSQEAANIRAKAAQLATEEGAEMLKLKTSIAEITKETKAQLQAEKDRVTIAENDLSSYNSKQKVLSALGRTIKSYVATTADEEKELESLKQRYLELNKYLQDYDTELGNNQRRVGSYVEALKSVKAQARELEDELTRMRMEGVDPTSEAFVKMEKKAADFKDASNDIKNEIKALSSDTYALDQSIGALKDVTSVFGVWKGSMAALGLETESFTETLTKLQGIQTTLSSLQQLQNDLTDKSTVLFRAKTAVVKLYTKSLDGASKGMKAFKAALISTGIGAIVVLVGELVARWDELTEFLSESGVNLDNLSKGWEKFMSAARGVGNVLVNYIVTPFKTAFNVAKRLVNLDFSGALDEYVNGLKKQHDIVGNFQKGYNKSQAKYAEERTRKQAAENAKQIKNEIDRNEALYGSDYKYTENGKKLWTNYYAALIKSQKKGTEERTKAENEYLKFKRDIDKKDEELKKKQIERARKYAEEFDKAWKTYQQDTAKMSDDNVKRMLENDKKALDDGKANTEESLKERRRQWKVYYASLDTIAEESAEEESKQAKTAFAEMIKAARQAGKNTAKLQEDLADRLFEIDQKLGLALAANQEALKNQLEKDQKELVKAQIESVEKMVSEGQASLKSRLETIQGTNLKNPTISMLKDMKGQYEAYLNDLEKEHKRFVDMLAEEMSKLNPDSDEYAKLVKKKEQVDKEYLTQRKAVSSKIADLDKNVTDKILSDVETYKNAMEEIMGGINDMLSDSTDRLSDELDAVGEKYDAIHEKVEQGQERIQSLNEQLAEAQGAQRLALQEQLAEETAANEERMAQEAKYAAQKKALEQKMADSEYKAKRAELVASLVQAVANTALAVTKAVSQNPMLGGLPGSAIATATGAIQIALISKQLASLKPVKLERGGYIEGPRHSQGGIRIPGTNTEIEGGEFVVNRRASARYRGLLEELNRYGNTGIRRPNYYANGGEISLPTDNSSQMVLDAIKGININPVVSVVDINRASENLVRVRQYARG